MITCHIRYAVVPGKMAEFEQYAILWTRLITKFGGVHYGFFLAADFPDAEFSHPGMGTAGSENIAFAVYTFPDMTAYESYRSQAAGDDEVKAATSLFNESPCFSSYERTFLKPLGE